MTEEDKARIGKAGSMMACGDFCLRERFRDGERTVCGKANGWTRTKGGKLVVDIREAEVLPAEDGEWKE